MIFPDCESATKISPSGAVASHRGCSKPSANTLTLKPGGTCGTNPGGGVTTTGGLKITPILARMRSRQPNGLSHKNKTSNTSPASVRPANQMSLRNHDVFRCWWDMGAFFALPSKSLNQITREPQGREQCESEG